MGLFLSARLALGRFHREKLWERREASYKELFKALFIFKQFYNLHYEDILKTHELTKDEQAELSTEYKKARRILQEKIETEAWLISDDALAILSEFQNLLDEPNEYWLTTVENKLYGTEGTIKKITTLARDELKSRTKPWYRFRR